MKPLTEIVYRAAGLYSTPALRAGCLWGAASRAAYDETVITQESLMEIRGRLAELIGHAAALSEDGRFEPLQLFVEDVAVITGSTGAIICNEDDDGLPGAAPDGRYRYVLMLHQVQQVLQRWCEQHHRSPTPDEACRAIMFFSDNDSLLPSEGALPGVPFVWQVQHRRGDSRR